MPTFYKRKAGVIRGNWTANDLQNAVSAITERTMTINQAARTFGVPASTIRRRMRVNSFAKTPLGPSSVLGAQNESKLVAHIKKLQKSGFSPTRREVRTMAYKLVVQLGLKHNFNNDLGMAGDEWMQSFLRRNPELSIRKAEAVSLSRAETSRSDVEKYFQLLRDTLISHDLTEKPGNLYNVDETGLQLNSRPSSVIAARGSKLVANITSAEKGETISVIACCNGEGRFLPPTCVIKGKHMKPEWKDGMPPGSNIMMSQKSAYVTTDLFFEWLKTQFVPRKVQGTVLLILDGHASHCTSVEMLEYAEENNILLLCLPSHSTHFLQPLDRSFFKSLKGFYYQACNNYVKMNPSRKINRMGFGKLLGEAWSKAASIMNAVSGFEATGIVPFNPEVIPDHFFFRDREQRPVDPIRVVHPPVDERNSPVPGPSRERDPQTAAGVQDTSNQIRSASQNNEETEADSITPGKMLDQISPVPVIAPRVQKARQNSKRLASILNCTNNITLLKEKKEVSMKRASKGKNPSIIKRSRKKIVESESSNDEEDAPFALNDEEEVTSEEEDCCQGCGESYKATKKTVDWIKCLRCSRWLHEDCSKYENYCDSCGKFRNKNM